MIAYIVVRKFITCDREATTIESVYSTKEAALARIVDLAKKSTYHNIRFHMIAKQIKGLE